MTFLPGDLLVREDMRGALWIVCSIADPQKKVFSKTAEFVLVLLCSRLDTPVPTICNFSNTPEWCTSAGLTKNGFKKVGSFDTKALLNKTKEL